MKIIEGRVSSIGQVQLAEDPSDRASRTYTLETFTIDSKVKAMLQRADIQLKKGDQIAAGGFMLFGRFMVMAISNKTRGGHWANIPWLLMGLGLFVVLVPLFADNPRQFTLNMWLFMVLPFVLVGAALVYFGLDILRTSRRLRTMLPVLPKTAEQSVDTRLDKTINLVVGVGVVAILIWLLLAQAKLL